VLGDTPHVCDAPSVRKQYHFWPAEVGFDAWDVDRLIELSRDLPVERVPLASMPILAPGPQTSATARRGSAACSSRKSAS
jgi:hypothetical protein